jgi:hypothetical protein
MNTIIFKEGLWNLTKVSSFLKSQLPAGQKRVAGKLTGTAARNFINMISKGKDIAGQGGYYCNHTVF